jgi:hypothetical protein
LGTTPTGCRETNGRIAPARLHRVDGRPAVAEAGDVRLVAHDPVKHVPALDHLARQRGRLGGRVQRRPLRPDPHPPPEQPPAGVHVQANTRAPCRFVELLGAVDHDGHVGVAGGPAQGFAVDARVGDDDVLEAVLVGQPERLGEGEGEDALQARASDQGTAAHRLRRQAHRLAAGPAAQVGGVGVEGVEVDDRERRLEVLGGFVDR